jgi:hypothetical protein
LKINLFSRRKSTCPGCTSNNQTTLRNYCTMCGRITKHKAPRFKTKDSAKIIAIISAILILLWIQMPVFATTHSPAPIMIQTPDGEIGNTQLFPNITGYNLGFEYRDTGFEEKSKQDYSLIFSYIPADENKTMIWIGLEIASTISSLHRWETCLVTWPQTQGFQSRVTQLDLKDKQILDNPPVIARYFAFQNLQDNQIQLVLYWYETSLFTINDATEQKQVEVSLITFPETPESVPNIENEILPVAEAIANYWQPIKTWAQVSMFISQNGLNVALTTTVLLAATVTAYSYERKRQEKTQVDGYKKLATGDQQLVDTIRRVQKVTFATVDRIKDAYQKTTNTESSIEQLEQKLTDLGKIGIVKNMTSSNSDEPIKTWKA